MVSSLWGESNRKFGMGVTSIFYASVRAIKSGIKEVIELDTAMTELNKVLDISQNELEDYTSQAYKMGEALGRTGKDVLAATAEFARAGYSLSESAELANQALLLTNVADGLNDTSEAAGYLIAVLKGYKKEASETGHIVDLLNEVSNNFAINTLDLADGLQRTSGTLAQTGTSMEQLTGLLVGSDEVLRKIEKSSSGLITISQRLRAIGEDGKEIDGLMPKLQKAFKEYAGIDIQTQNGQLRSTYDILSDLSKVWDTLNDEQRQYIGELTSGTRQAPVLNSILGNWSNVEKAASTAMNSMGSAVVENEKYMDSLEGRIASMKSAFSELAYNTIQSETVGAFINLATYLAKAVNSFGGLNTIFITSTILLTTLNKSFKAFLAHRLEPIVASWATSFMKLEGNVTATAISIKGLTISTQALTAMTTMGISLAIAGLIKFISTIREAEETQRRLIEESANNIKSTEQEIAQLESLRNRYSKLLKEKERGIDVDNELLQVQRQLANMSESLITGLDNEGNYISENIVLTERLIERKKELLEQERKALQYEAQQKLPQLRQQIANAQAELDDINKRIDDGGKKQYSHGGQTYTVDVTGNLQKEKLELVNTLKELEEEQLKWMSIVQKGIKQEELSAVATAKNDTEKQIAIKSLEKYGLTVDEITDLVEVYISSKKKEASSIQDANAEYQSHEKLLEKATESYEDITDKLIAYNKILAEINSKEGLQGSTRDEIIRKYQELAPYIDNEAELRKQLIRIIGDEERAQKDAYKQMILYGEDFFNSKLKGNELLVQTLGKYYTKDLENAKNLAHAKEMVESKLISKLSEQWGRYYRALVAGDKATENGLVSAAMRGDKEANALLKRYKEIEDAFAGITTELSNGVDFKSINLSGVKDPKEEKGAEADYALKYKKAIEELSHQLSILKSKRELTQDDRERIKYYEQEIELLEQQKMAEHDLANAHRQRRDELAKQLSKQGFSFTGKGDSLMITNLDRIQGKTKETKAIFDEFINIQTKEIPSASQSWWSLQQNIESVSQSIKDAAYNLQKSVIEQQKKNGELQLELLEKEVNSKLAVLDDELKRFEDRRKSIIDDIQSEIDEIQESERLRKENQQRKEYLNDISSLKDKIYYMEQIALGNLSDEMAKQVGLEEEKAKYQEKQIKLQELQIRLQNLQNEKNIQQLQKLDDGTFDYVYVADQEAIDKTLKDIQDTEKDFNKWRTDNIDSLNDQLKKKQDDYYEWERTNRINKQIQELQDEIKYHQEKIEKKRQQIEEEKKELQDGFNAQKQAFSNYYRDIDLLTQEQLNVLKETTGSKWDEIAGVLSEKYAGIKAEYESLIESLSQPLPTNLSGGGGTVYGGTSSGGSSSSGGSVSGSSGKSNQQKYLESLVEKGDYGQREWAKNELKLKKYHDGGIVGKDAIGNSNVDLLNKLANTKPNEQVVKALIGEVMIPPQNIVQNFIPNMQNFAKSITPNIVTGGEGSSQVFNINKLEFPNVKNSDDIKEALLNLPRMALQYK